MDQIVIFGVSDLARMARFYFTHDSPHDVVAFTIDRSQIQEDTCDGLPVVAFDDVEVRFPPDRHAMLVCVADAGVAGPAAATCAAARARGYMLTRYVSSKAVTWPDAILGDNCFVLEGSVLQPHCRVGNDVVVAPGAIVGHHSAIGDHCRLGPNAVVLGGVRMDSHCVVGANATIRDGVAVAQGCVIGAGVTISKDTKAGETYPSRRPELLPMSSDQFSPFLTWPR